MQKLREDKRLLLVPGPTGSGKTSVIQAGVLPLLSEGKTILRSFSWEIVMFTQADQAVRHTLAMLPRFLSRINMGTGRTLLFSDDGCHLATAGSNGFFYR